MSQPRYQIFVSSTFKDLQEERQAVLKAILKLNQFPAGMEIFPAANDTAWELIEKVIKDSDYYVLIIGGKYGSMEKGVSYTEKEYDFAVSQNIPVLAFVRSDTENIPIGKSEIDAKIRKKLENFKKKVGRKHHLNYWTTPSELKEAVSSSLSQNILTNPQRGWIKAGGIEKNELLERLADLQQKYDHLLEENQKLKDSAIIYDTQNFVQGDDEFHLVYMIHGEKENRTIKSTWNEMFLAIGEMLLSKCFENDIKTFLQAIAYDHLRTSIDFDEIFEKYGNEEIYERVNVAELSFSIMRNQFLALNLIKITEVIELPTKKKGHAVASLNWAWELTVEGRRLYLSKRALVRQNYKSNPN